MKKFIGRFLKYGGTAFGGALGVYLASEAPLVYMAMCGGVN